MAAAQPDDAQLVLGGQAASTAGMCTEVAFAGTECRFDTRGDRLSCRQ